MASRHSRHLRLEHLKSFLLQKRLIHLRLNFVFKQSAATDSDLEIKIL